jgi:hypothetical protein
MMSYLGKWAWVMGFLMVGLAGFNSPDNALGADEGKQPTKTIRVSDRYDNMISTAEARYHQAVTRASKIYREAKRKADAEYAHDTAIASTHVTETISEIRDRLTQSEGTMGMKTTQAIKGAVANYAKTISKEYQKRQKAIRKAVVTYAESLSAAADTFKKELKRAEPVSH